MWVVMQVVAVVVVVGVRERVARQQAVATEKLLISLVAQLITVAVAVAVAGTGIMFRRRVD
jgi:hypothetical protein